MFDHCAVCENERAGERICSAVAVVWATTTNTTIDQGEARVNKYFVKNPLITAAMMPQIYEKISRSSIDNVDWPLTGLQSLVEFDEGIE